MKKKLKVLILQLKVKIGYKLGRLSLHIEHFAKRLDDYAFDLTNNSFTELHNDCINYEINELTDETIFNFLNDIDCSKQRCIDCKGYNYCKGN